MKVTISEPTAPRFALAFQAIATLLVGLAIVSSGCSRIRLPAFDPTGQRLFAPLPTTTGLALPGSTGEGCGLINALRGGSPPAAGALGQTGAVPTFSFPTPAFVTPEDPPACPVPAAPGSLALGATSNEPCVPSAPCNGACSEGPRAVLLGSELDGPGRFGRLPDRGKRGCILLSPQRVVAPVGGEVVLLSGVCGDDGYLQLNEPLEWMLTPDSVGTFIDIGDDEPGVLGRLARSRQRSEKKDPNYAIGITSIKKALITRGNLDPNDDIQLEKGQTWLSISSPSEGVSRVTVLAPESECWDQRKATATIYWVDARWQFPSAQIVPAGTPARLTTRVTRSEGVLPARGWKVRYQIQNSSLATFAGTNGSNVIEATVDDSGNATAELIPVPGTSGITGVNMEVIRPGGEGDNLPPLKIAQGQTFVTWSSPQLAIRAGAPAVASFNVPFTVAANVSNPGDQAATNVRVDLPLPDGVEALAADSFARVFPNVVTWDIGTVPPQTQLDISVDLTSRAPVDLVFTARGDSLIAEDSVRVDIFRPSLTLAVRPLADRVEAGKPVTFEIDVTNTSDRVLQNALIVARGDQSMIHESGEIAVESDKPEPLQPGETWKKQIIFTPTASGRRCITVEATASGGQRAPDQQACVIAINPTPKTPTLNSRIDSVDRQAVGELIKATARIVNEGQGVARNVRVEMVFDPQLQAVQASSGYDNRRLLQRIIGWNIPEIAPGAFVDLTGEFRVLAANPQARVGVQARSDEGATTDSSISIALFDRPVNTPPPSTTPLPPASPPPTIPGGPGPQPLQGAPRQPGPSPIVPQRSNQLLGELIVRTNPVRVGEPIRYALRIENDSDVTERQVDIRFELPPGVSRDRIVPITVPNQDPPVFVNNEFQLPLVPLLRPGEAVEYEIVLRSNQVQTFLFEVRFRGGENDLETRATSVQTTVIQ